MPARVHVVPLSAACRGLVCTANHKTKGRLMYSNTFCMLGRGLAVAAAAFSLAVAVGGASPAAAAHDRFKATIPDGGDGEAGELRTPLQFEEEAADHPQSFSQALF